MESRALVEVLIALIGGGALLGVAWIGRTNHRQHNSSLSKLDELIEEVREQKGDLREFKTDFRHFKIDYRDRKLIDDDRFTVLRSEVRKLNGRVNRITALPDHYADPPEE